MAKYDFPPYYISAYGLAVRQGFEGTLDEWLESLQGVPGDSVELRYNAGEIQWRQVSNDGTPTEWQTLYVIGDGGGVPSEAVVQIVNEYYAENSEELVEILNEYYQSNPEEVAVFRPSVDSDGNLSWSNNAGLPNPETVNIKGPKGDSGAGMTGLADVARVDVTESADTDTIVVTGADGSTSRTEILWVDGYPQTITVDGRAIPVGWTVTA